MIWIRGMCNPVGLDRLTRLELPFALKVAPRGGRARNDMSSYGVADISGPNQAG
jgi:hypothetical protein